MHAWRGGGACIVCVSCVVCVCEWVYACVEGGCMHCVCELCVCGVCVLLLLP